MLSLRPKIFSELFLSCSTEYLRYYKQSAWSWLFLKLKRKCSEEMRQNQEVEEVISVDFAHHHDKRRKISFFYEDIDLEN